jgi:hypothetical protein
VLLQHQDARVLAADNTAVAGEQGGDH